MHKTAILTAFFVASCASDRSSPPLEAAELETQATPPGGNDAPPRFALTLRAADGSQRALEQRALAHASSGAGIALIDAQRRLVLIAGDGTRRVLAERAGAPPASGARGELFYVAIDDTDAQVRVVEADGRDRALAHGLASAGVLAPQADGTLFFVGAKNGGVAGLWSSRDGVTRCLTNCDLKTGEPWGDRFVPPPGAAEALEVGATSVEWLGFDGNVHAVSLGSAP